MPVFLATQKAEIRRIMVQSQPRQIVLETVFQKYLTQNRAARMVQVVEHLSSKCGMLSSKKRKRIIITLLITYYELQKLVSLSFIKIYLGIFLSLHFFSSRKQDNNRVISWECHNRGGI
jgi:hypothetical protein